LLTKELQHLEAEIMVDTVLNQLTLVQGRKNILSLHDGIVCPSREVEQVKLAIGNAFQKWQIQVPIKIQNLSNPDELVISDILNQPKPLTRKFFYEIRVKGGVRKFAA
jgi:hypothetical protein